MRREGSRQRRLKHTLRRSSPKMLVIRAIENSKLYLPVLLVYTSTDHGLDGWLPTTWSILFWYYSYTRVYRIFFDWWTTRYKITHEGVRFRTGLFVKDEIVVRWHDMASVQISRPVLQRALSCSMVHVGIGSAEKRLIALEAVTNAVAREISTNYGRATGSTPGSGSANPAAVVPTPRKPVYEIRPLDYLLLSITYGQFLLFFPFAVSAYIEVARWFPLPMYGLRQMLAVTVPAWTVGATVAATLVASVGYGYAVAWLRYRSFTVHVDDGALVVSGGLISEERRQISHLQVCGLKVQQNPLMRLLGRAKLSVVARESGRQLRTNVVFPVLGMQRLREGIDNYFPEFAGVMPVDRSRRRSFDLILFVTGGVVTATAWVVAETVHPGSSLVVGAGTAMVQLIVANRLRTAITVDVSKQCVRFRRGFLWVLQYEIPITSVHVAGRSQGPLGRLMKVSNLSLLVYDSRRVRLRLIGHPESHLVEVCRAVMLQRATVVTSNLQLTQVAVSASLGG